MSATAVIRHQPEADGSAVAGRIPFARLPIETGSTQMAIDGSPEAVRHHLLPIVDNARDGIAQSILPEDAGTIESASLG